MSRQIVFDRLDSLRGEGRRDNGPCMSENLFSSICARQPDWQRIRMSDEAASKL
jgi:hypothetical protein